MFATALVWGTAFFTPIIGWIVDRFTSIVFRLECSQDGCTNRP
jgi:hypothetical protein